MEDPINGSGPRLLSIAEVSELENNGMLVVSRKVNEQLVIAGPCIVTVLEQRGDKVRLGIQAKRESGAWRRELWARMLADQPVRQAG